MEHGLEVDEKLVFQAGATIEEGAAAALQFSNEQPKGTAMIAANDLGAFGAANTLLDQGISIPQDLSVAGFGNVLSAEYFRVPLTTVRQPKYRRGLAAMESMKSLLAGESVSPKRLPAELAIRKSTTAPAI